MLFQEKVVNNLYGVTSFRAGDAVGRMVSQRAQNPGFQNHINDAGRVPHTLVHYWKVETGRAGILVNPWLHSEF